MAMHKNAKRDVAQGTPRFLYMGTAKRGKPPPVKIFVSDKMQNRGGVLVPANDRMNVLAAMAELACHR